jgi:hypothetical protein
MLESGTAGANGAKYRFSNVASGIDAIIEIKGRSSASVVLGSIDTSGPGLGYVKAFQPVLGIPGTAPANTTWSMDFEMIFYKAGTNIKQTITEFNVTGLDIDGDGSTLYEWTRMNKLASIDSALTNSLTFINMGNSAEGNDYKVEGIIATSPGIDTIATNLIATYKYKNKNKIDFTIGAKTAFLTTRAGMRLNSFWFKQFSFTPITLPVKLISFTAMLNNNKVDLRWVTSSEMNASHFVVERSTDGTTFSDAGAVFAYGNTTEQKDYQYTDNISSSNSTIIYYRLRQVDIDGKFEYSAIRIIRIGKQTENNIAILTYPNPVTNELRVTVPSGWQGKEVVFEVYNQNGQKVKAFKRGTTSQTESIVVSDLAKGFYLIKATCGSEIAQQKIIKN